MKALKNTPMRAALYVALLIAGLLGSAGIAVAQEPTPDQQSAIRSNCRSDFMANCSGVPRGGKEAMQCLKDNVAKLSSGCQQAVRAVMPAPASKPSAPVTATPAAPAAPPPAAMPAAPVAATPCGSRRSGCSGHFHRDTSRGKTGGPCRLDATRGRGKARCRQAGSANGASKKRGETSSERAGPRRRRACPDRGRAASPKGRMGAAARSQ